ncbi:DUF4185 domain-containing protein [Mycolicibacterium sp.]|uniref:DUF4185 domain-containing protein n=1 Tax=Mycolicibacterium sp. TaxID=2320850 RepID=UPI0028ABB069|nr:DUF4185 domain-containing protein [Mycolicibacterium sp.]
MPVGRVGSLAVALGVGLALSTGCAVAYADESDDTSAADTASSASADTATDTATDTAGDAATAIASPSPETATRARSAPTASGARTAESADTPELESVLAQKDSPTTDEELAPPDALPSQHARASVAIQLPATAAKAARNRHAGLPANPFSAAAADRTPAPAATVTTRSDSASQTVAASEPAAPAGAAETPASAPAVPSPAAATVSDVPAGPALTFTTAAIPASAPSPATAIRGVVDTLLAAFGLGPLAAGSPLAPVETSALWGLLAWTRREFQRTIEILGGSTGTQTIPTLSAATATPLPAGTTLAAAATTTPTTTPVAWLTGPGTTGSYLLSRTNNTAAMFGIAGTDIGAMWDNGIADNPVTAVNEHQVLMAFGDTFSGTGMTGTWRPNVLLRSSDATLADGITVRPGVVGDIFSGSPLSAPNFSRQIIKSPGYLGFQGREVTLIPTAGISVPYNNAYGSRQYVSYMSVKSWDTPGRWTTNYAAVAYSDDNGQTWTVAPSSIRSAAAYRTTTGYVSGNQNFQQSAFVRPPARAADSNYVYAYGTPSGRNGTIYLSRVKQTAILDQTQYEYWNGNSWVLNKPSAATPLLPGTTTGFWIFKRTTYPSAGEMSVQYNTYLNKYVMMYTDSANNVVMRTAAQPQGPWSPPTTLATSAQYLGLYAPMMNPWSTGQDVYWNMSLWGDYNVLLMHTRLV